MKILLVAVVVSLVVATCESRALDLADMGTPTGRTPYDRYFGGVQQTLSKASGQAQMGDVQQLLKRGRGFRYSFTTPYIPQEPEITERTRTGDCKAKSLWMADRLNDGRVRFVVGKLREGAKQSHMWLMWQDGGQWWVLDPTIQSSPKAASSVGARDWVPLYSYSKNGRMVHAATARYAMDWDCPDPIGAAPPVRSPWHFSLAKMFRVFGNH